MLWRTENRRSLPWGGMTGSSSLFQTIFHLRLGFLYTTLEGGRVEVNSKYKDLAYTSPNLSGCTKRKVKASFREVSTL